MLRLTYLRQDLGMSQAELARRAGLHHSTVSIVESGRLRPYPSQLEKISEALCYEGAPERLLDEVEEV